MTPESRTAWRAITMAFCVALSLACVLSTPLVAFPSQNAAVATTVVSHTRSGAASLNATTKAVSAILPGQQSARRVVAGRVGRLAVYFALFVAIGAMGISAILVPRLRRDHLTEGEAYSVVLDRMALAVGVVAGVMLFGAIVLRTLMQYGDASESGTVESLSQFLSATSVGRSLAASTILGLLVAISAAIARSSHTTRPWRLVQMAAVVLFIHFWVSTGHTAGDVGPFGIRSDIPLQIHVVAAGLWTGSLAVLFVTVLPLALRDPSRIPLLRATVQSFSPVALVCVCLLAVTGLINAIGQLGSLSAAWSTLYGQTLLLKVLLVAILVGVAAHNWLTIGNRVSDMNTALAVRATVRFELLLATLILITTSVLVATTPPN